MSFNEWLCRKTLMCGCLIMALVSGLATIAGMAHQSGGGSFSQGMPLVVLFIANPASGVGCVFVLDRLERKIQKRAEKQYACAIDRICKSLKDIKA
ncbi:MAG: hypothetical protein Q8Q39_00410 [bacterium]|nr:hypothetical protein [bacterium]